MFHRSVVLYTGMLSSFRKTMKNAFAVPYGVALAIVLSGAAFTGFLLILFREYRLADYVSVYKPAFSVASLALTILVSILAAVTLVVVGRHASRGQLHPAILGNLLVALFLAILVADCPRCASFLGQLAGQGSGAIAVFPFHGLAVKAVVSVLLVLTISLADRAKQARQPIRAQWPLFAAGAFGLVVLAGSLLLPDLFNSSSMLSVLQQPETAPNSCTFK